METEKETFVFREVDDTGLNALQNIVRCAVLHRRAVVPIVGDCMEGAGIEDGGRVAVDFTRYPRHDRRENGTFVLGDPCLCWAVDTETRRQKLMCKRYSGIWMGHYVSTHYRQEAGKPFRMNAGFPAILILGVVFASWGRDGTLLWRHAPEEYPTTLPNRSTITGGNVGKPMLVKEIRI